jgi:hypothetical protein
MARPVSKTNQLPTSLPKTRKERKYNETRKELSLHRFISIEWSIQGNETEHNGPELTLQA